jgi:hypothetical protein
MSATIPRTGTTEQPSGVGLDKVDAASAASMDASDPPAFGGATGVGATDDGDERQEQIRRRAYELWEEAGSPTGREMDFWLQAEREIGER